MGRPQAPQSHAAPARDPGSSRKAESAAAPGRPAFAQAFATTAGWLHLQRSVGNRETVRLLIGASNDALEREADRIAHQVVATPAPAAVGGAPPSIQRFATRMAGAASPAPASVELAVGRSGRPLEPALRQDMEQRFGRDFSAVRVHDDGAAWQSARDLGARAYTLGHHVFFGAGQFAPGIHQGQRLLAHELTHVVQQAGGRMPGVGSGHGAPQMAGSMSSLATGQGGVQALQRSSTCIEPTPLDIATVNLPMLPECATERLGASVWTLRLSGFERDMDTLTPCHRVALGLLLDAVEDAVSNDTEITGWEVSSIVGHASPEGEEDYNEQLALRRAEAVFSELAGLTGNDLYFTGLAAPIPSGERCAEGAPPERYPYFRAVDVTIEFSGISLPPPPYRVPGRGNVQAQPQVLEGRTARTSLLYVRDAPNGRRIGRLLLQEMHVEITDKVKIGKDIWLNVVFGPADLAAIRQAYPHYIQGLQVREQNGEALEDHEQAALQDYALQQTQPTASTETWVGEDAFGYAAMRYDKALELIDAFDRQYADQPLRDRLTRLRQIGEKADLPGDFTVGHGEDMPGRMVRDDRSVDPRDWSLLLEAKQVLMPNSEIVDLHHFIFGIDALASPPGQQRADLIMTGTGAGLRSTTGWDIDPDATPPGIIPALLDPKYHAGESYSTATWSGDVGGAVGDYVYKASSAWEAANPKATKADRLRMYFETRAPKQDLLADIDSWGFYQQVPQTAQAPSRFNRLRDLIEAQYGEGTPSEARTLEYERQVSIGRATGIREFLCHYGFSSPNNLRGQSTAVDRVVEQVRLFGEVWYLRNAGKSPEQFRLSAATSQELDDASKEMSLMFLDWLEDLAKQNGVTSINCKASFSTLPKGSG